MLIPTALSAWNSFSTRTPFWSITPTYYEVARERLRPSNPGDAGIERAARVVEETYGHLIEVSKAHIQLLVLKEHVLLYAPMDRPRLHVLSAHPRLRVLNSRLQSRVIDDHLRVGEVILSVAPHVLHGAHWLAWRFHGNISTST
ncbi:hypothetical protein PF007_g14822 [Phytophthora fragariae]|uniref:Uncharacterized protein n=1 Tax=Phytophthora fragariae TaxID=53985 RepID=A0A6A3RR08_9STRA|nr:hypothetical protein PF007_g14822 [Phytophthora fragariae]